MSVDEFNNLRVLIVAEHASARFGGEAILPLQYFRRLRARGIEAWLIVHERTRAELEPLLGAEASRVSWVPDTWLHRLLVKLSRPLPHKVGYFTFRRLGRLYSQILARRIARRLIAEHGIDVVHQPIPVSPRESSLMHSLGAPVVMGPMNGAMSYPPGFGKAQPKWISVLTRTGQLISNQTNRLLPGKIRAAVVLVANERTRRALPPGVRGRITELVENGVDFTLWNKPARATLVSPTSAEGDTGVAPTRNAIRFAFSGRLIPLKAVDLLLKAFARVTRDRPAELIIIGDGPERPRLEKLAGELGIAPHVIFRGWVPHAECAAAVAEADVFILPSLHECGGAVILEAMALGLPVIATNWGGPADYIDASCGILVDPVSPERFVDGLADAMTRLAADESLRDRLGRAGREKVEASFDWERKIDAILAVYHEATSENTRARPFASAGTNPA